MILHERFDAAEVLRTIEREKVTYIGAVPTMCERMLHVLESKDYDTSSLRCLAITGGKVHPSVLENLKNKITPNIYRTYASTDSGQMAISKPADIATRPASAGRPVWCTELKIIDEAGQPMAVGEVGEILTKSPLATQGYYKNPAATEASFRDGWFHTLGLGGRDQVIDNIGNLFFTLDTDFGPTAGQKEFFGEIQPVYRARMEEVNKFLRDTLPQWNDKLRAWNA